MGCCATFWNEKVNCCAIYCGTAAIEWADGSKSWYLNGKKLTEKEFNNMNDCDGKIVEIDGKKYKLIKE